MSLPPPASQDDDQSNDDDDDDDEDICEMTFRTWSEVLTEDLWGTALAVYAYLTGDAIDTTNDDNKFCLA